MVTNGDQSLPALPVRDSMPGRRRQRIGEQCAHGRPDDLRRGVAQELVCALAPACHDPVRVHRGCHAAPCQVDVRAPRQPVERSLIGPVSRHVGTRSVTVHRIPPSHEAVDEPASSTPYLPPHRLFISVSGPSYHLVRRFGRPRFRALTSITGMVRALSRVVPQHGV